MKKQLTIGRRRGQSTEIRLGGVVLLFSYETCVAMHDPMGVGNVKRENVWGSTTGRHQNEFVRDHGGGWDLELDEDGFRAKVEAVTGLVVR